MNTIIRSIQWRCFERTNRVHSAVFSGEQLPHGTHPLAYMHSRIPISNATAMSHSPQANGSHALC